MGGFIGVCSHKAAALRCSVVARSCNCCCACCCSICSGLLQGRRFDCPTPEEVARELDTAAPSALRRCRRQGWCCLLCCRAAAAAGSGGGSGSGCFVQCPSTTKEGCEVLTDAPCDPHSRPGRVESCAVSSWWGVRGEDAAAATAAAAVPCGRAVLCCCCVVAAPKEGSKVKGQSAGQPWGGFACCGSAAAITCRSACE